MGGNKGGNSISTVTIPPEVLARYSAVNANAEKAAATPFQSYSGQFVAPLTATQQSGIANTNAAANQAQPSFQQAQGLTAASAYNVNPSQINASSINQYMSPYLQDVVGSESALLNQNNQQQQSGQMGTAITSGAFGGDRSGIAAANLNQQQNLANASIYSGLLNTGYNNALSTAQQQQGVDLSAQQSNRANLQNVAQQYAGLGAAAQSSALQGAQAQLSAGQQEQQTAQAQDSALYNQFLQQQSYPFQTAQFLANIAEGTGVNSGSTTSTNTSQNGIFSDERLKQDVRRVGETYDGQKIYTYKYKGHPQTHMGLMAQEVEGKHPAAVGLAAGYKTVNYDKATDKAADRGHFAGGGLAYGGGGGFDPGLAGQMLANYQAMYAPLLGGAGGLGGAGRVPSTGGGNYHLQAAQAAPVPQSDPLKQGAQDAQAIQSLYKSGKGLVNDIRGIGAAKSGLEATPSEFDPLVQESASVGDALNDMGTKDNVVPDASLFDDIGAKRGGRIARASGGDLPYVGDQSMRGMDIPDEQNSYQLKPAQGSGGSAGGGGGLGAIGSIASTAMKIIPFFQAGGRVGRADGGSVDDGEDDPILKAIRLSTNPFGKYGSPSGQVIADASGDGPDVDEGAEPLQKSPEASSDIDDAAPLDVAVPDDLGGGSPKSMGTIAKGGHIDPEVVSFFKNKGLSDQVALGIAAGINAESGNNPNAVNPKSGAMGLGQWMGSRQKGLLAQYGPNPSKSEQLNYLWHELKGGDRGGPAVLAANDAPTALGLYVTKFMRPKAGSETEGDLARGLGAIRSGYADGGSPSLLGDPDMAAIDSAFDASFPAKKHGLDLSNYVDPTDTAPLSSAPMPAPSDTPNASGLGAALASTNGAAPDASAPIGGDQQSHGFFHNLFHSTPGSDDHTNAVLSALSGLAGMATAPTRNIGYALASGLQSGVGTYQGLRKYENVDLPQVGANVLHAQGSALGQAGAAFDSLYHWNPNLPNPDDGGKYTGAYQGPNGIVPRSRYAQTKAQFIAGLFPKSPYMQQYASSVGAQAQGVPSSPVSPAGATPANMPAPSAPLATDSAPQATPQVVRKPSPYSVNAVMASATPPTAADEDAANIPQNQRLSYWNKQLELAANNPAAQQDILKQIEYLKSENGPSLYYNWANRQGQTKQYLSNQQSQLQDETQNANEFHNTYSILDSALKDLSQQSINTDVEANSPVWSSFVNRVRSIPGIGEAITPDQLKALSSATGSTEKASALAGIEQAVMTHVGSRAIAQTERLVAGDTAHPTIGGPGDRWVNATRLRAVTDQAKDWADAVTQQNAKMAQNPQDGGLGDVSGFKTQWFNDHPIESYLQDARTATPFFKGTSLAEMQAVKDYIPTYNPKQKYAPGMYVKNQAGKIAKTLPNGQVAPVTK